MVLRRIQALCLLVLLAVASSTGPATSPHPAPAPASTQQVAQAQAQAAQEKKTAEAASAEAAAAKNAEAKDANELAEEKTKEEDKGTSPFIDPETMNFNQLIFVTLVYSYILYQSSNLISDGSELLLLVPSVAGLVGSIVLPILGAVPDGMMTLASGLGPDAQNNVAAGIGVMSGSTVMLLTFPWFIAVMYGKVPTKADHKGQTVADYKAKDKSCSAFSGAVTFDSDISKGAFVMILTTLLFLIIQVPSWKLDGPELTTQEQAEKEKPFALAGVVACCVAFVAYLGFCLMQANEDKQLAAIIAGIKQRKVSLSAALSFAKQSSTSLSAGKGGAKEPLVGAEPGKDEMSRLQKILRPFFAKYDTDSNGTLDKSEHEALVKDLGLSSSAASKLWTTLDQNSDGKLEFQEFSLGLYTFMASGNSLSAEAEEEVKKVVPDYGIEDEEPEEMPEDIADLPENQQQYRIITRSCWMMGLGTAMVVVFSDPLVDCLTALGKQLGIKAFYVAFILAPFASNASELLSAYNYAIKKTSSSITTSLSTLVGAACMNNTFCLGVMYALVYFRGLAWQFKAETISIMLVQWIMGLLAMGFRTHSAITAIIIILLYPACLILVQLLEEPTLANLD